MSMLAAVGAVWLAASAMVGGPEPGEAPPAITLEEVLQAPAGARASWEALEGKVVVLEFWATWCGPCVAAIPHLNELSDKYKDKPIICSCRSGQRSAQACSMLKKHGFENVYNLRGGMMAWESDSLPVTKK